MTWVTEILQKDILESDRVLEFGCGIFMTTEDLKCKSLLGVDAWESYLNIKKNNQQTLKLDISSIQNLNIFLNNSYDVVVCIDVIEHLDKDIALEVIKEMIRISRKKVIIFTPDGFAEQEDGLPGTWGHNNPQYQKHRSGWFSSDFENLNFKIKIYPDTEHNHIYATYNKETL